MALDRELEGREGTVGSCQALLAKRGDAPVFQVHAGNRAVDRFGVGEGSAALGEPSGDVDAADLLQQLAGDLPAKCLVCRILVGVDHVSQNVDQQANRQDAPALVGLEQILDQVKEQIPNVVIEVLELPHLLQSRRAQLIEQGGVLAPLIESCALILEV